MNKRLGYSPEVRERAVRLVLTSEHEHTYRWAAIQSVATIAVPLTFTAKPSVDRRAVTLSVNPLEAVPSNLVFRTGLSAIIVKFAACFS